MGPNDPKEGAGTAPPSSIAQTTPRGVRSYDEMNTSNMVFEMQGTVGEIKEAIASLTRVVENYAKRIEATERTTTDIKGTLASLTPKVDDIVGFIKHGVPNLAKKEDLGKLMSEIEKRPTRRQAVLDVAWIVGVIGVALTIGSRVAH